MTDWKKDRDKSRHNALKKAAEKPFTLKELAAGKEKDTYMPDVGKEGIKRQQEKMRITADNQTAAYSKKAKSNTFKKARKKISNKG